MHSSSSTPASASASASNANANANGNKNQVTTTTDPLDFGFCSGLGLGPDLTCIEPLPLPLTSPPKPNLLVPCSPPLLHNDFDFTSHPHSPLNDDSSNSNNTSLDAVGVTRTRTTQVTPNGTRIRLPKSRLRELTLQEINRKRKLVSDSHPPPQLSHSNAIPHSLFPTLDLLVDGLNTTDDTCITSSSTPSTANHAEILGELTQFTHNDDDTIPNLTSLLLNESDDDDLLDDDQQSPSSLDLDEYALIEALNSADNDLRLDTLSLLTESQHRQRQQLAQPRTLAPTNVRATTGPSRIPRLRPPTSYSCASSSLPSPPRHPPPPVQHTHHISPLSVMDPHHLAHLGKVYGLAFTFHSLTLSLAALADLRKSAGLAASLPGPTSTAALAEAVAVRIDVALPGALGGREFHADVRHSAIARANKAADKDHQHVVPSVEIPLNLAEPVPVHFDANLVQVFLQQALQVNVHVGAKPPRSFSTPRSKLSSTIQPAEVHAHESIRLVHIMQAHAFTHTCALPLFASGPGKRYLGELHMALSLLPTPSPADLTLPPATPPSPAPSPPLVPRPPSLRVPPPPFPLALTLTLGVFTPLAPARASVQTHLSASTPAHALRIHLSTSLYLALRLVPYPAPPIESKPVHWTCHVVDQVPGAVADQVGVAATVASVDFDTRWHVPVSVAQVAGWAGAESGGCVCVEVWRVVERVAEHRVGGGAAAGGDVDRALVGVVKVPVGQVVAAMVAGVGPRGDGWDRAVPVGLDGVECPVVDMVEGKTRGWVEVGVSVGQRGGGGGAGPSTSPAIEFGNARGAADVDEHNGLADPQPRRAPSAHVHVRFHTLCGMATLVTHTLTSLLDALASTHPPVSPAHRGALAALAADPSSLNLYVTLALVPKHVARQLATDPAPVTSHVAWHAGVPQWSAAHAGCERVWHGVSDEMVGWMREGTKAVAVGKVWHRFENEEEDRDEGSEVPDLLVGEFRVPLARMVERPGGWAGAWFPVHAPRVVGVESGVVGVGAGISVPKCHKVASVLVDVGFDDLLVGGVGEFGCVRVRVAVVADVRSVEIHEAAGKEWEVAVDVASVFDEAAAAEEQIRAKRPVMWDGEVDVTAAVLQHVLEGKLVVQVFEGTGDTMVGFAHVDTFALAHALLRLVNSVQSVAGALAHGRVVADRVAFREHVVCPDSSQASGLVVSGSVSVRVVGMYRADASGSRAVDEEVQVGPLSPTSVPDEEDAGMPDPPLAPPKEDAFTSHLQASDLITDAHADINNSNSDDLLPIQITVIQASGFALSRQHAHASSARSPTPSVYVSFVWSTDTDAAAHHSTASFLASSVLTLGGASHVADRHLVTSPAAAPEPAADDDTCAAAWAYTSTVMQSISRHALQRLKLKKVVVFKLWQQASAVSSDADRLIGFAKVDVSPLANGLRELHGWYNIMSYRGGVAGQVHVRIRPVVPVPDVDDEQEEGEGWVGQLARSAMMSSRQRRTEHEEPSRRPPVGVDHAVQAFERDESVMLSMTSFTSVSLDVVSLGLLPDAHSGDGGQAVGGDSTSDSSSDDEEDDETLYREPIRAIDGADDAVADSTTTSSMSMSPLHSLPSSPFAHASHAPATPPLGVLSSRSPSHSTSRALSASRHNSPSVAAFMSRTSTPTTSSDLLPYRPGLAWSDSDSDDSDGDGGHLAHSTGRSPARYGYAASVARPFAACTIQRATEIGPSAVGQMREHARAIQAQIEEVVRKFGIHD